MQQQFKQQLRKAFILNMERLMEKDEKVWLLYGDVGFSFMEPIIKRFPKQVLNCGIAEQNMMGMAVGLTHVNIKPYVYTMSNFILLRPYEQVRNDICYGNANVKLFGVKGSEAYKFLGMSHNLYGNEEQNLLAELPNITKHFPQTEAETEKLMLEEYERFGPSYTRI